MRLQSLRFHPDGSLLQEPQDQCFKALAPVLHMIRLENRPSRETKSRLDGRHPTNMPRHRFCGKTLATEISLVAVAPSARARGLRFFRSHVGPASILMPPIRWTLPFMPEKRPASTLSAGYNQSDWLRWRR